MRALPEKRRYAFEADLVALVVHSRWLPRREPRLVTNQNLTGLVVLTDGRHDRDSNVIWLLRLQELWQLPQGVERLAVASKPRYDAVIKPERLAAEPRLSGPRKKGQCQFAPATQFGVCFDTKGQVAPDIGGRAGRLAAVVYFPRNLRLRSQLVLQPAF